MATICKNCDKSFSSGVDYLTHLRQTTCGLDSRTGHTPEWHRANREKAGN